MVLALTEEDFQEMQRVLLDRDAEGALLVLRALVKRVEKGAQGKLKSHLDR